MAVRLWCPAMIIIIVVVGCPIAACMAHGVQEVHENLYKAQAPTVELRRQLITGLHHCNKVGRCSCHGGQDNSQLLVCQASQQGEHHATLLMCKLLYLYIYRI